MDALAEFAAVRALFQESLDLPPERRREFVLSRTVDDGALREAVLRLLAHDEAATGALDGGARAVFSALPEAEPALPESIGPYRPERVLGRGGMGVVLLATRSDGQFRQQVALKLIRSGLFERDLVGRFRREREILARLTHPHVARLTDGGVTDEGMPWFAMEYVDGEPLVEWCDRRMLGVRARVQLFLQVLDAVDFAHRNLVVHRDLKPSNILVTGVAPGHVKLLDFGIAKLLDEAESEAMTGSQTRLLTPEYAAPEQILGEPIGIAADIYALGVVLFELLTSRLPYPGPASGPRVAAAILDAEPDRLRQALSRRTEGNGARELPLDEIARRRGTDAARLRTGLDRDLEQVAALALAKRPEHRYASVAAMADDLRAWLEGRALRSRPAELGWRLAKFVRRHRFGVAAAGALLAVLFAGVAATVYQWREARHEAEVAQAVRRTLTDVFAAVDPDNHGGAEPTLRDVLDGGLDRIRRDPDLPAAVRLPLLSDLGQVYSSLGEYERASEIFAVAERDAAGEGGVDLARLNLRWAEVDTELSRFDAADAAIARARALPQPERDEVAFDVQLELAASRVEEGRDQLDRAMTRLQELLARLEAERPPRLLEVGHALNALGSLYLTRGRSGDGEALLRRSLEYKRAAGMSELRLSSAEVELARALREDGRGDDSLPLMEGALRTQERILGADHPLALDTRSEYALSLHGTNNLDAAAREFVRALEGMAKHYGEDDPAVAVVANNYGVLLYGLRRFEEAAARFEQAYDSWRRVLGPAHERTLQARANLAGAWTEMGNLAPAGEALEALVAARRERGEPPTLMSALLTRGLLYERQSRVREAAADYAEALKLGRAEWPDNQRQWAWAQTLLARAQRRQGETEAARVALESAVEHYADPFYQGGGPRASTAALELARALDDLRVEPARALELAQRSLAIRRLKLGEEHADTREAAAEVERLQRSVPASSTPAVPGATP
jgi:serine/threonine protein kinase